VKSPYKVNHRKTARNETELFLAIASSRTPPWLPSGWGCRGRRLSRGRRSFGRRCGPWSQKRIHRYLQQRQIPICINRSAVRSFQLNLRSSRVNRGSDANWSAYRLRHKRQLPSKTKAPLCMTRLLSAGRTMHMVIMKRKMTLGSQEFLRRFLLHVLPRGFVRIRSFGFLANRRRARLLPLCQRLLADHPTPHPARKPRGGGW